MGMGSTVSVSVGALCVSVSVGKGVEVCEGSVVAVSVGIGVKVSTGGIPVEMLVTTGEGESVGLPLLKLQARVVAMKRIMRI